MKFQIKSRWPSEVRFECELDASFETESYGVQLGAAVKLAIKARAYLAGANLARANLADANLAGANLAGANLAGANLAGANLADAYLARAYLARANLADANLAGASLAGANLAGANLAGASGEKLVLVGPRPAIWFGPIGRDQRTVYAFLTDRGVYVRAGCFFGTLDRFKSQVIDTHGSNEHAREYAAFVAMAETHFALFPVPVKAEAA